MFRRYLTIATLIMAGEAVFFLPYMIQRVFRPTFLEVFDVTNLEVGIIFSAYGTVAMVSYFLGGPLADRFSARALMALALAATATGGFLYALFPSMNVMIMLFAYWGLTTVLLFWAALIRATREWGGESQLGTAFGLLDAGRGLFAASMGVVAVFLFASLLPADVESASLAERSHALKQVILMFAGATFLVSVLTWFTLPPGRKAENQETRRRPWRNVPRVLAMPAVWLQAIIIFCAYVGYKAVDDISLYAHEVLGLDEVRSAGMAATVLWVRPVSCIIAGLIADRTSSSAMTLLSFAAMAAGALLLASGWLQAAPVAMFLFSAALGFTGIYALRGLYFAIMGEAKIPLAYTGTAVGVVSTIGYIPDVFMLALQGYILGLSPGPDGHFHFFTVIALFAFAGILATGIFRWFVRC